MTTNKTFLILLLLGVSYTAYNAAAVSENFEISTTIDHEIVLGNFRTASTDAELDVMQNLNLGTVVIDPSQSKGCWSPSRIKSGCPLSMCASGGVISVNGYNEGRFYANVDTNGFYGGNNCNGLSIPDSINFDGLNVSLVMFYDRTREDFSIEANVNSNTAICYTSVPSAGTHTGTLTISYTPS
ncbi:MAG: hypothetical protein IJ689_01980 [Alphaproteobacteria bacterium]|nr:hypothetical protein [Alphaproteobacteria bacterium]